MDILMSFLAPFPLYTITPTQVQHPLNYSKIYVCLKNEINGERKINRACSSKKRRWGTVDDCCSLRLDTQRRDPPCRAITSRRPFTLVGRRAGEVMPRTVLQHNFVLIHVWHHGIRVAKAKQSERKKPSSLCSSSRMMMIMMLLTKKSLIVWSCLSVYFMSFVFHQAACRWSRASSHPSWPSSRVPIEKNAIPCIMSYNQTLVRDDFF